MEFSSEIPSPDYTGKCNSISGSVEDAHTLKSAQRQIIYVWGLVDLNVIQ